MIVKMINGQAVEYSIQQLRRDNPNISFPKNIPDAVLESYGLYRVSIDEPKGKRLSGYKITKGKPVPEYVDAPDDDLIASMSAQVQARLDDFAKTRDYDGILSLCTYIHSTNPAFKAEAEYGIQVRDATWAKMIELLGDVKGGKRQKPTTFAEIEPELPVLAWPTER